MDYPILGLGQEQTYYTIEGLRYGYYLFELISGKIAGEQGLYYLALAAGMVGTALLLLNPKFQKPSTIACWVLLLFITIIGPHASNVFFYKESSSDAAYIKGFNPQVIAIHTFSVLHKAIHSAMFNCVEKSNGDYECSVVDPVSSAFNAGELGSLSALKIKDDSLPAETKLYQLGNCGSTINDLTLAPYNANYYASATDAEKKFMISPEKHAQMALTGFNLNQVSQAIGYYLSSHSTTSKGRPPYAIAWEKDSYKSTFNLNESQMGGFDLAYAVLDSNKGDFQSSSKHSGSFLLEADPSKDFGASQTYLQRVHHNQHAYWSSTQLELSEKQQNIISGELKELPVRVVSIRANPNNSSTDFQSENTGLWANLTGNISSSPYTVMGLGKDSDKIPSGAAKASVGSPYIIETCADLHKSISDRLVSSVLNNLNYTPAQINSVLNSNNTQTLQLPTEGEQKIVSDYYKGALQEYQGSKQAGELARQQMLHVMKLSTLQQNRNIGVAGAPIFEDGKIAETEREPVVGGVVAQHFLGTIASWVASAGTVVSSWFEAANTVVYIQFLKILINMALMAILIATPLIYLMGILIPGYAPGILIITIGSVVILKMVPVTYTIVDAMLKIMSDVLLTLNTSAGADDNSILSLKRALLVHAAAGMYTSIIGITLFIMFKIGDPSSLQQLTQLDSQAKDIASKADNAAKALAITSAAVVTGGTAGALGAASAASGKGATAMASAAFKGGTVQGLQPITRAASNIPGLSQFMKEANPADAYQEGKIMQKEFFGKGKGLGLGDYRRTVGEQKHDSEVRRMQAMYRQADPDQKLIEDKGAAENTYERQKTFAKGLGLPGAGNPDSVTDADGKKKEFESRYVDATRVHSQAIKKANPKLSESEAAEIAAQDIQEIMKFEAKTGAKVLDKQELKLNGQTHVGYSLNSNTGNANIDALVNKLATSIQGMKGEDKLRNVRNGQGEVVNSFYSTGDYTAVARQATVTGGGGSSGGGSSSSGGGGNSNSGGGSSGGVGNADILNELRKLNQNLQSNNNSGMAGYSNRPVKKPPIIKK